LIYPYPNTITSQVAYIPSDLNSELEIPCNYLPQRSSALLRLRGGTDNDIDEISQSSNDLLTLNSLEFHTMKIRALNTQSIQHPTNMIMR
jgi:hypothetical protein